MPLSEQERNLILAAKERLMTAYDMTEEDAYQFIRKTAMNNLTTRVIISTKIMQQERLP